MKSWKKLIPVVALAVAISATWLVIRPIVLPGSTSGQTRSDLTEEDFRKLRPDMTLDQVYAYVGKPAKDLGSGIYILEYVLSDGSFVFVGSSGQTVLYVRHGSLHDGTDLLKSPD